MADGSVRIEAILEANGVKSGLDQIKASVAGLKGEASGATDKTDDLSKSTKDLGGQTKGATPNVSGLKDSLAKASTALTVAGATMTDMFTRPLVDMGRQSIETTNTFEDSMRQTAGALGDASRPMEGLRKLALDLGASTKFSANEAGAAMVELAKGGLTEAQIQGGALAAAMDLAAAGGLSLSDAANTTVQAMGAFNLSADDSARIANALSGAANASSADVSDLTMALSQCSAQASTVGWSIEDTTAALALFADAGVTGSDAGTSLKTMLQRLAAPTDKAADLIEELGINVRDSQGNFKPLEEVAGELRTAFEKLSPAERDAALMTIFGSDASRAASIIIGSTSDTVKKYTDATNDSSAASEMAAAQQSDLSRAMEEMGGAIETAQIALGQALAPAIMAVAKLIQRLADWFSNLPAPMQTVIAVLGVIVATLGPLLTLLGQGAAVLLLFGAAGAESAGGVGLLSTALSGLSLSTLGIAGAIVGIVAVIGLIAGAAMDAAERQENLSRATDGLAEATEAGAISLDSHAQAMEEEGEAAWTMSEAIDSAIEKQGQLAESIQATNDKANGNIALLNNAAGVIEQYANKSGLSVDEQHKLASALEIVNDQCGTEYELVDAANGVIADGTGTIQENTDAIFENIEAKKEQIKQEALLSELESLYQQQASNAADLAKAEAELAALQKEWDSGNLAVAASLGEATWRVSDLRQACEECDSAIESVSGQMENAASAAQTSAGSLQQYLTTNQYLNTALAQAKVDVDEFAGSLTAAGVSQENLSSLSESQLVRLVQAYDGSTQSIIDALGGMGEEGEAILNSLNENWKSGFSEASQSAIQSAAQAKNQTVNEFLAMATELGVAGDEAMQAYCAAIQAGDSPEVAAQKATETAEALKKPEEYSAAVAEDNAAAEATAGELDLATPASEAAGEVPPALDKGAEAAQQGATTMEGYAEGVTSSDVSGAVSQAATGAITASTESVTASAQQLGQTAMQGVVAGAQSVDVTTPLVEVMNGAFTALTESTAANSEALATSLTTSMTTALQTASTATTEAANAISTNVNACWQGLATQTATSFDGVGGSIQSAMTQAEASVSASTSAIANQGEQMRASLDSAWKGITSSASSNFSNVTRTVTQSMSQAANAAKNGANSCKNALKQGFSEAASSTKSTLSQMVGNIRSSFQTATQQASSAMSTMRSTVSSGWQAVVTQVRSSTQQVTQTIKSSWQNAQRDTETSYGAIKNTATNSLKSVAENAKSQADAAASAMERGTARMQSAWNSMHFGTKHIPLPHFSVSGTLSANPPSVPHFSVYWAKKGGIADSATLLGFGEAGREALMPLQGSYMRPFASAVADELGAFGMGPNVNVSVTIGEFVNSRKDSVGELVDRVEREIQRRVGSRNIARGYR